MASQALAAETNPDRPALECRVYERASCEIPTSCHPASLLEGKEMRWSGTICDISQGGVKLILQRRFERGTGLAIELPGDATSESSVVFVKVVHLKTQGDGSWALGCKFISELSDDQVRRLMTCEQYILAPAQKEAQKTAAIQDVPADAKILANVRVEIWGPQTLPSRFTIKRLDVTQSWPVRAAQLLRIDGTAPDQSAWAFEVEIVELSEHADGWRLRGRIVESTDAEAVMRAIGKYKRISETEA